MFLGESETQLQDCLEGGWRNRNTNKSCTAPKTGFEMVRLEEINITQAIRKELRKEFYSHFAYYSNMAAITLYSNQTAKNCNIDREK